MCVETYMCAKLWHTQSTVHYKLLIVSIPITPSSLHKPHSSDWGCMRDCIQPFMKRSCIVITFSNMICNVWKAIMEYQH